MPRKKRSVASSGHEPGVEAASVSGAELGPEGKRIEVVTRRVGDLKHDFGNPRKINAKKLAELRASMETFGDFGLFLIDEYDQIIAGNQRATVLVDMDPDIEVTCKQLIGYSEAEKRAINIKDNTHSGEWDFDLLADWTADLTIDLGLDSEPSLPPDEREIKDMELIRYEKYDYVLIVCKSEIDYNNLTRRLGLDSRAKVKINDKHKIKARAVWFHEIDL